MVNCLFACSIILFFFVSLPLCLAVGLWGKELSIYYTLMSTFVLRFLVMSVQFCVLFFRKLIFLKI